jgi:hypothetical protein
MIRCRHKIVDHVCARCGLREHMIAKPIPKGSAKLAAKAAADILRETKNTAIGYGDSGLLHLVCARLGWPHEGPLTEHRVLNAIDRHHDGFLHKRWFRARNKPARVFYLPEEAKRLWPEEYK